MVNRTKAIWSFVLDGEVFIFLFLVVGQFKASVPTVLFVDTTLLIMILGTVCILRRWVINRERVIEPSSVVLFGSFMLIVVFALLAMANTSTPQYGRSKLIDLVLLNGWPIVAAASLIRSKKSFVRFCVMIMAWGALLSVNTIYNAIQARGTWDISPLTTNYIAASLYIYSACFICWIMYIRASRRHYLLLLYTLTLIGGFLLAARSSFLLFLIVFALISIVSIFANIGRGMKLASCRVILSSIVVAAAFLGFGLFDMLLGRFAYILPEDVDFQIAIVQIMEGAAHHSAPLPYSGTQGSYVYSGAEADVYGGEEAEITRSHIFYNASYDMQQRMDYVERYFPLINTRYDHDRTVMPLHFDQILYNNASPWGIGRWEMLLVSLRAISIRPIAGWGLGGFALITLNRDTPAWPHNLILEMWVEMGALSLIPLMVFFLYPLYTTLYLIKKKHENTPELLILLALLIFWMGFSMFGNLTINLRTLYVVLAAASSSVMWGAGFARNPIQKRIDSIFMKMWSFFKPKKEGLL